MILDEKPLMFLRELLEVHVLNGDDERAETCLAAVNEALGRKR